MVQTDSFGGGGGGKKKKVGMCSKAEVITDSLRNLAGIAKFLRREEEGGGGRLNEPMRAASRRQGFRLVQPR